MKTHHPSYQFYNLNLCNILLFGLHCLPPPLPNLSALGLPFPLVPIIPHYLLFSFYPPFPLLFPSLSFPIPSLPPYGYPTSSSLPTSPNPSLSPSLPSFHSPYPPFRN